MNDIGAPSKHATPTVCAAIIRMLFLLLALSNVSDCFAVTIALWTFETSPPADVSNAAIYPNAILPDVGIGSAGGVHSNSGTDWTTPTGNGSDNGFNVNYWDAGNYYEFAVPTTGFKDITVSWDQTRSSSSAPATFDFVYSSTGNSGPFVVGLDDYSVLENSNAGLPVRSAWSTTTYQPEYNFTVNLSSISALNSNANVVFRLVAVVGASAATATVRVDNFLVTGVPVPEPSTLALMLAGVLMLKLFVPGRRT